MNSDVMTETEACPSAAPAPVRYAPVSGWRRVMSDWVVVGGTTFICQGLGVIISLGLRWVMSPALMGLWQALKLFLTNANYANAGISKGAARELSIALGRGQPESAQHGVDLAFTVNTLTSFLYAVVLAGAGMWVGLSCHGQWSRAWAVGLVVIGVLSVVQRYVTFQVTLLRARQEFVVTSQLSVIEAVLTLAVCVGATYLWGLWGLYFSTLVVLVGSIVFVHYRGAVPWQWAWDWPEIRRLVGIGGPILMAGIVSTLFRSLDKLMILGYMSDREFQLGCYSLALLVTAQLYGLGNMLAIVIGPRMSERFGYSGRRRDVAWLAVQSSELQAATMVLPAALAMVAGPPLLAAFLPAYRSGLPAMLWLIPGTVALNLALLPAQYLVSVDREKWSLAAIVLGTAATAAGNHFALRGGWGINGVAATTSLGYALYLLLVAGSLWRDLDLAGRVRYVFMHVVAVGPTLVAAGLLEWLWPAAGHPWMAALVKSAVVTAAWGGSMVLGWTWGGWSQAILGPQRRQARQPATRRCPAVVEPAESGDNADSGDREPTHAAA